MKAIYEDYGMKYAVSTDLMVIKIIVVLGVVVAGIAAGVTVATEHNYFQKNSSLYMSYRPMSYVEALSMQQSCFYF